MKIKTAHIYRKLVGAAFLFFSSFPGLSQDTTRYPIYDRYGDPYTYRNRNTFDLSDTAFIRRNVEYDPKTKQYYVIEKIGNKYYRTPVSFSMEEFIRLQGQ